MWAAVSLCAALAVAAPSASERAETIRLASTPRAGAQLAHTLALDQNLALQRLATTVRGAQQIASERIAISSQLAARFVDEVRTVEAGRATSFRRAFDAASLRVEVTTEPPGGAARKDALEATSPLRGVSVLYTFAPARGDFGRLYDGREASEEYLGRLGADLELAWLLPAREVAVGDGWDLEPARLRELFAHGGEVPLRFARGGDHVLVRTLALGAGGQLAGVFGGSVTGTARARLAAVEDGEGGRRARIALELDVRVDCDQTALFDRELTPGELGAGLAVRSARLQWSFRGAGEVVWSVAEGRLVSAEVSGAEEVEMRSALEGPDGPASSEVQLSGGLKLRIDVGPGGAGRGPR